MNLRKALQWLIALACTAAAVLNILYLTGAQPKSVTSIGCAAKLSRISINLKTGLMGIDCGVRIRLTGANYRCAR